MSSVKVTFVELGIGARPMAGSPRHLGVARLPASKCDLSALEPNKRSCS